MSEEPQVLCRGDLWVPGLGIPFMRLPVRAGNMGQGPRPSASHVISVSASSHNGSVATKDFTVISEARTQVLLLQKHPSHESRETLLSCSSIRVYDTLVQA